MRERRRLLAGVWLAGALTILAIGVAGLWGAFGAETAQAAPDPLDITFDERLMLTTPSGAEVTLISKSAGYSNTFGMQSPTAGDIFSCDVPYGTTVSLGVFTPGELVFRLKTPPGSARSPTRRARDVQPRRGRRPARVPGLERLWNTYVSRGVPW